MTRRYAHHTHTHTLTHSHACTRQQIAAGIAAQLSPEYASNADKPSGPSRDDILDGSSVSSLDKPSRYLGTPYTHVVTWQVCYVGR